MMAVGGTLAQCIESFERFVSWGATNLEPRPIMADEESHEILTKEIIPYFKSKG